MQAVPTQLRTLVTAALASNNIDSITLSFGTFDAATPNPMEWSLHLGREQHSRGDRNRLRVTADPEDQDAQAYVGPIDADDPYLRFDGIYDWINEPRTYPYTNPFDTDTFDDASFMLTAWEHGWIVRREIARTMYELMRATYAETPIFINYELTDLNPYYNTKGHSGHRSTGAPLDLEYFLTRNTAGEWPYASEGIDRVDAASILALAAQPVRYHAPVQTLRPLPYDD